MPPVQWWVILVLWSATATMIFAPGNFARINGGGGFVGKFFNAIDIFGQVKIVWALLAVIVVCCFKDKSAFIAQIKEDYLVWSALGVSLAFGFIANSYIQSFTGQEFYSLIIIFRLLPIIFTWKLVTRVRECVAVLLLVIFGLHQGLIIEVQRSIDEKQSKWLENYKNSDSPFQPYLELDIPSYAKPYMRNWFRDGLGSDGNGILTVFSKVYGRKQRDITILGEGDRRLLDVFEATGKLQGDTIPGNIAIVTGERFLWTTNPTDTLHARMEKNKIGGIKGLISRYMKEDRKEISYDYPVNRAVLENGDTIYYLKKPGFNIISLDSK